jgi:hypothetical protein
MTENFSNLHGRWNCEYTAFLALPMFVQDMKGIPGVKAEPLPCGYKAKFRIPLEGLVESAELRVDAIRGRGILQMPPGYRPKSGENPKVLIDIEMIRSEYGLVLYQGKFKEDERFSSDDWNGRYS